jgi:hypothetical protein
VGGVAKFQERIFDAGFVGRCTELVAMESNLSVRCLIFIALSVGQQSFLLAVICKKRKRK